jgi:hypothetical protein
MKTTTQPKVSAAELKRQKDAYNTLVNVLSSKMVDFKERYLKSYVEFKFSEFDTQIKRLEKSQLVRTKYNSHETQESFDLNKAKMIERIRLTKSMTFTRTLEFINEAAEGYKIKFDRLVSALIENGVRAYPLKIERVASATSHDFSFLIQHNEIQVYARIIFAEGEVNAPHYRYIITVNKNLLH